MKEKIVKYLIYLVILSFFTLYFVSSTNLYEYKMEKKKTLTEDSIKKFEEDVKNGVQIDINDYIIKDKNYDNKFTIVNREIANYVGKGFENIIKYIARYMNKI